MRLVEEAFKMVNEASPEELNNELINLIKVEPFFRSWTHHKKPQPMLMRKLDDDEQAPDENPNVETRAFKEAKRKLNSFLKQYTGTFHFNLDSLGDALAVYISSEKPKKPVKQTMVRWSR